MSEIKIIQNKILEILKIFIETCEENNLTYYALGGTLLGAVRHGGFIPWDDDIDIGMPREDYEKFKKIANEKFNDRYLFLSEDTPGYKKAFSVIRDTTTKIVMNYSNIEQEESLWIDIFPIDGLPKKGIKRKLQEKSYLYRRMMVQLSQFNSIVNQNKANRPWYETAIIKIAGIVKIENLLSFEKAQQKYLATIKKYSVAEGYAGNYTGAYKLRELVPSEYFGNARKLQFETVELSVPEKYNEYIKKRSRKAVALTFDDGPNPNTTPVALELLKQFIELSGGDGEVINNYELLPTPKSVLEVFSEEEGFVTKIKAEEIGKAKTEWAQKICPYMDINNNRSPSFNYFKDKLYEFMNN